MSARSRALTPARAAELRKAWRARPKDEGVTDASYRLAKQFRVSPSTVGNVVRGRGCYGGEHGKS